MKKRMDEDDEAGKDIYKSIEKEASHIAQRWLNITHGIPTYRDFVWAVSNIFGDYQLQKADPNSWRNFNIEYVRILEKNGINVNDSDKISHLLEYNNDFSGKFVDDFTIAWPKWLETLDPILRGMIVAYMRPTRLKFSYFSPQFWTRWAGGNGTSEAGEVGVMFGNKGSGKTDFALKLAEMFVKDGWKFASNIQVKNMEYHYTISLSQLLKVLAMNADSGKRTFAVIDELAVAGVKRQRTMSGRNLNLEDFFRITRKLDASIVLIWHYPKDETLEVQLTQSFKVFKHGGVNSPNGRGSADISFKIGDTSEYYYVSDIPKTGLEYQTNDLAPFFMDIDLRELLDNIVVTEREHPESNIFRDIIEFIDELHEKQQEQNEQPDAKQYTKKEESQGIKLTCDSCGFSWNYKGKKAIARCPNCNHRINLKSITGGGGGGV